MTNLSELENLLSSLVVENDFILDDRTIQDTLSFVDQYVRYIPYQRGGVDTETINWERIFFMGNNTPERLSQIYTNRESAGGMLWPQQALLLAFLQILQTPRVLLNSLPGAHRELYYRQLLGLVERPAEPAKIALSLKLQPQTKELLVPFGTLFSAGQDKEGQALLFGLDRDILANQCTWTDLRWCRRSQPSDRITSYIAFEEALHPWPEGGLRLFSKEVQDQDVIVGRMLASAALEEPNAREFEVQFSSTIDSARVTLFQISGGQEWLPLQKEPLQGLTTKLTFTLNESAGSIEPPMDLGGLTLNVPVLQLGCGDQRSLPEVTQLRVNGNPDTASFDQYALTPFGYSEEPQPVEEAELYLGFTGIKPSQTISLYWQIQGTNELSLKWQYLNRDNRWSPLDASVIDETLGLFRSGRWSAILPADASDVATSMPLGRYWLRALTPNKLTSIDEGSDYPFIVGTITNGMTATLANASTLDAGILMTPIPADSVSQPVNSIVGLVQVEQPWPSWGGRPREATADFFRRTALRLAHRQRAVTWQDMVVILKARFKAVFDVALPSSLKQAVIPARSEQRMIVIPLNSDKDNNDPLRPIFNQANLYEMENYLQARASPWQNIRVSNPYYREVPISYELRFREGINPDYGYRQVRLSLEKHYMPWLYDEQSGVKLGSRLEYYDVIAQIQQQPTVESVIDMTLDGKHISAVPLGYNEAMILVWTDTKETKV